MRSYLYLAFGLMLLAMSTGTATSSEPDQTPEAKWARGIADDFWKACLGNEAEQAAGLLSVELTQAFVIHDRDNGSVRQSAKDILYGITAKYLYYADKSVTFSATEIAPDRSEIVFKGVIEAKDHDRGQLTSDFSMRIAKESATSRWSIRYYMITDRKEPGEKRNTGSFLDEKAVTKQP